MIDLKTIRAFDPEVADAMQRELRRQNDHLELIASENFVSARVLAAMGSHLTNKYAEGYPGKRYYGGCEFVDEVERLAIERAKQLFGAEHANVQPHSGSQANLSVYVGLLNQGDTILGMDLAHGGHLTHGSSVNLSGRYFHFVSYGVQAETGMIDYDDVLRIAKETRPKLIVAGASAYPRALDFQAFRRIADEVGALLMVDMAHIAGLVATGMHMNPVPYADVVTTTTHKTLRGPRGGMILCKAQYAKSIDKGIFPGTQGGPLMHVIAAKAVCLKEAMTEEYQAYGRQIVQNAAELAERLKAQGIRLVSGGTDNHLMLLDLRGTGVTGKQLEEMLGRANITVNKNSIPFDPEKPITTSGIRVGTPAVTTRGLKETEMRQIADLIARVLREGESAVPAVRAEVEAMTARFPLYAEETVL